MAEPTITSTIRKRNDAYTGILAISFLAMTGATVLLYLEYQNYENKTPPKAPTIDVPGVQLKTLPGTGGPPPPPPPMMMPPDDPEKKDPAMMMMRQAPPVLAPRVVETASAAAPMVPPPDPVVTIPDVPVLVPVSAVEPIRVTPPPIIPVIEPNLSDAPPAPVNRFAPPM